MNLILVLTNPELIHLHKGFRSGLLKRGGGVISQGAWNGKITLKQTVAELIKIQFEFTSFKFKLQINQSHFNTFGMGLIMIIGSIFLFTGRWAYNWGGGLINGGAYRQQFLPRGVTSISFCWVCAAGLSDLLSHYSLFCGQIIDPIHWHMPISLLLGSTRPWSFWYWQRLAYSIFL